MKKILFFCLFTYSVSSISQIQHDAVYAGDTTDMLFMNLHDSEIFGSGIGHGNFFASDSIDLDFDGKKDLVFESYTYNLKENPYLIFGITIKNPIPELEFCSGGSYIFDPDTVTMKLGEPIVCNGYRLSKWQNVSELKILSFHSRSGFLHYSRIRDHEYLPVRIPAKNGYAYGWIHLTSVYQDLTLHDYAIQKKDLLTSVKNNIKPEFQIFPNPAIDDLTVCKGPGKKMRVEIYDALGKIYLKDHLMENCQQMNISYLPKGIFFVKIFNGEKFEIKKIIKK